MRRSGAGVERRYYVPRPMYARAGGCSRCVARARVRMCIRPAVGVGRRRGVARASWLPEAAQRSAGCLHDAGCAAGRGRLGVPARGLWQLQGRR